MRRLVAAAAALVALTGCTAAQQATWENFKAGRTVVVVCWEAPDGATFGDAGFWTPCKVDPPARLNLVLATDQDDDVEWYRDRCDSYGGRFTTTWWAGSEEFVCEGVDY